MGQLIQILPIECLAKAGQHRHLKTCTHFIIGLSASATSSFIHCVSLTYCFCFVWDHLFRPSVCVCVGGDRLWVQGAAVGGGSVHDAVDAERALGLDRFRWLHALNVRPEVRVGTAGFTQRLEQKGVRRGHQKPLLDTHVWKRHCGRALALHTIRLRVGPVSGEVHECVFGLVPLEALPAAEETTVVEHVL